MTLADFFWLDDAKFAEKLSQAPDRELIIDDKHNARKRKGGKLGAWVGTAQAPFTLGISLIGTSIGVRNRHVAKRRLVMIHAELERRRLPKHAEDWKDAAFATLAVGAGAAVGMGFAPGAEIAAQHLAEAGASHTAQVLTEVATSQLCQNIGSQVTEVSTSYYTNPDTYFLRQKGIESSWDCYGQPYVRSAASGTFPYAPASYTTSPMPTPSPQYGAPGYVEYMPILQGPLY